MEKTSLKKILSKKDVSPVVHEIIKSIGAPLIIEDDSGGQLLRYEEAEMLQRYPVEVFGEVIGWVVGDKKVSSVASLLSILAGREMEERSLAGETLNKYKEITLLYEMAERVALCLDHREVARLVIDEARKIIRCSSVSVMLLNEETGELEIICAAGTEHEPKTVITAGEGIAGAVLVSSRPEIVNDVLADPRYIESYNKARSMMCAPLKVKDRVIGVINISSDDIVTYKAEDLKLFTTLASQAAVAIENARLFDSLKETFFSTVHTLAETIEKRDPYTGGHTKRVMEYSLAMGRFLGLDEKEMTRLELSSVLHDIGKIGIRDSVLLKEGRLNDEEFSHIKMHTVYGEEIMEHIKRLRDIIPGVKQHHEKFNGLGYPDGLKGNEIDIIARIIAVADSFDAMTSDRPYRKGLSLDVAAAELQKCSGTQFDPDVVNAFFSCDIMEAIFRAGSRSKIME